MTIRRKASVAALAVALGAGSAANAVTIGGITFESGSVFETIDLFEAERLGDGNGNENGVIDVAGEELVGIGIVNRIRNADNEITWENGDNGKELVFYFHDYIARSLTGVGTLTEQIYFSGGEVEVYSQAAGTFGGVVTNNQAADIAAVTSGGNLWLSLTGSPIGGQDGAFDRTLSSMATGVNPGTGQLVIGGFGNLDVLGGAVAVNFDQDTLGCDAAFGVPCPDIADVAFTSSGQLNPSQPAWAFRGTGEVVGYAVPVPGTIALLGLGLVGLGLRGKAKRKS